MANARRKPWISPEEYLAAERTAEIRHEYVDGEVFAMSGASRRRNTMTRRIATAVAESADRRGCQTFQSDVKVHVEAANAHYYPDIVVTCDPADDDPYVVHAPVLVVEVLSETTERTDRREKRPNYQTIPSLLEIVLVSQDSPHIEVYRRAGAEWTCELVTGGAVTLESVGVTLDVETVYA